MHKIKYVVKNVGGNNGEYERKLGYMGLWGTGPFISGAQLICGERMELSIML